jgi:hypothetical protein
MIHSLESFNYFKLNNENFLVFECSKSGRRLISINQEYFKSTKAGVGNIFKVLYQVELVDVSLRELLVFKSLYTCQTLSELVDLVDDQESPCIFYKSCLELEGANMTSILSFDSRSIKYLLKDEFKQHFSKKYPLIYKNKNQTEDGIFYLNAMETALKKNQVAAVAKIMEFVIKYQENSVSSFLFINIMTQIIDKGLAIRELLNSKIFYQPLELDQWPQNHPYPLEARRSYHDNIFLLEPNYEKLFPEDHFKVSEEEEGNEKVQFFKIKYHLNLLPSIGFYFSRELDPKTNEPIIQRQNEDTNLLELFAKTDEISIFETKSVRQLIQFKWEKIAYRFHLLSFLMHMLFMTNLMFYVSEAYVSGVSSESLRLNCIVLLINLGYPIIYELIKASNTGVVNYFTDIGNYGDFIFLWSGVAQSLIHL